MHAVLVIVVVSWNVSLQFERAGAALLSYGRLRAIGPTGRWSCGSLVLRAIGPTFRPLVLRLDH